MRRFVAAVALTLLFGACKLSVEVSTIVHRGGSGTFRITFAFDKELIGVVRSSSAGKDALKQLEEIPATFGSSGWNVTRSEPDGGVRIDVERAFANPKELNDSIASLGKGEPSPPAFLRLFKSLHLATTSGFWSTRTSIEGTVDLANAGLLPPPDPKSGVDIRSLIEQAAGRVFSFKVRAALPGRVRTFAGSPDDVSGGTVVWSAGFSKPLDFSATAIGPNPTVYAAIAIPALLLLSGVVLLLMRRRARRAPVPGWEVGAPAPSDAAEGKAGPDGEGQHDGDHDEHSPTQIEE